MNANDAEMTKMRLFRARVVRYPWLELVGFLSTLPFVIILGDPMDETWFLLYDFWAVFLVALVLGPPLVFTRLSNFWADSLFIAIGTALTAFIIAKSNDPVMFLFALFIIGPGFFLAGLSAMIRKLIALYLIRSGRSAFLI